MSFSFLYILIVSFFLLLVVMVNVISKRKCLRLMSGMMISMSTGMMIGILGGTIVGFIYSGNLYFATILGILAGITAGAIIGLPFGILAVLDGFLSGLMGGMMGAMLGAMVSSEYQVRLISVLFTLYTGVVLILLYLMNIESHLNQSKKKRHFIENPIISSALMVVIILGLKWTGPIEILSINEQTQKSPSSPSKTILIKATEFKYSPQKITLEKGETITFVLKNDGSDEHDVHFVELEGTNLNKQDTSHIYQHNKGDFQLHAKSGEEVSATIKIEKAGNYKFYCTIPGHKELGMVGNLKVL